MKLLAVVVVVGGLVYARAAHLRRARQQFTAVTEEAARIRLEQAAFQRRLDDL